MGRNSTIQIAAVLAAVLVLVLMIRRSPENHDKLQSAPSSRAAENRAHTLQTSSVRSVPRPGSPANLRFAHLSVAEGLSHADVRAIAQDRQGFMWFGTWLGGLNRYDGYTFKVYKHDDQDSRSLGCDRIWALYVDRTGVLWVGTYEGIDRYDQDTDSFVHYRLRADDPTAEPAYDARSFMEDESGTLWVTSSGGLNRFDRPSGRFVTYGRQAKFPPAIVDTDIWSMCLDRNTALLWVGTVNEGVRVLDRSTGQYTIYKNDVNNASLRNNEVQHIYQDRTGTLWFSTLGGLNRFDSQTHGFVHYVHDSNNPASLSDNYVKMAYEDPAGRFWVATNNGLNLMDRDRGTFTRYLHDPNDSSSLSSDVINSRALFVDASGALWIGTRSAGVNRLAGEPARFTTYLHNPQDANTLSNDVITALSIGSGGVLWVGTEAGLDRFDGKTFTHYVASPNDPRRLTPGPERSVAQDHNGAVWTATLGGGLDRLEGERVQHFHHDPADSDSPANDYVSSLVPDSLGGLWMGVHREGVDYFDGRHFSHFPRDPADPAGVQLAFVRSMLLDRHGTLWIGTSSSGLARLDTRTEKLTTYLMDPKQLGRQAANYVEDVYSDGTSLWIASGVGLFRFDPEAGKFTRHYTESDGLANNAVVGVLGDDHGDLWVSTIKGLSRFDPRTERFRNYDVLDGLQANEFSPRARAKAPDGRLFFGGIRGLSAFYPDKLVDNPNPPAVVLTEFELFNNPVKIGGKDSPLRTAINVASSITLSHAQSVFRFQFAALDFTAPQKNRYAYRLEGFDQDWQYADATRRFATYTNLDPGDYTFRVKASNNDGVWNEQGAALQIRILPAWWGTWWFRAVVLAWILLSIWYAHRLRISRLRREFNAQMDGRVKERLRVARDLHDTLLQSFQASLIGMQAARNVFARRPEKAVQSLDDAITMAAGAVAEGRNAIQNLRAQPAGGGDLAQLLTATGQELAHSEEAQGNPPVFRLTVEGERRDLEPLLQDEVYRIARELLRNAFRHAQAGRIEAEIRYESRQLRLHIRDDGKGIDPEILEAGGRAGHWGLPGMRERVDRFGGKLEFWSEAGAGTEALLTVPAAAAYGASNGARSPFSFLRKKKARS